MATIQIAGIDKPIQLVSVLGESVLDSAGTAAYPDNYAHTFTYNADGSLATDAFTDGTSTWTKTYTYTTGQLTGESKWVKS